MAKQPGAGFEVRSVFYLVDGNNVMGQRVGWHRDKPGARRRLVDELARFARSTGEPVEVVFDGAPDERLPEGENDSGVRVHYAERGSDADTRIAELVERQPQPRALTVVTSDRRLADHVRRLGAQVVRSGAFRRRLEAPEGDGGRGVPAGRPRRPAPGAGPGRVHAH